MAQAVERALDLLMIVGEEGGSVTSLARRLGVDKSTTSRMVGALEDRQLVHRNRDGSLSLGSGVLRLARRYMADRPLLRVCEPYVTLLQRETDETVLLVEPLDEHSVMCVAKRDSQQHLRIDGEVGARMPLFCGASGKAILAFLPADEAAAALAGGDLRRYGPRSPATAAEVLAQLPFIRSQGYVYSAEELHAGVCGIAAPILDADGHPVAAFCIVGPMARVDADTRQRFVAALHRVTAEIRSQL